VNAPLIACSELSLSRELRDAWDVVRRQGVDAIEVFGSPNDLRNRLSSLQAARRAGVVLSAVCIGPPFLGQGHADTITELVRDAKLTISIAGEIEVAGIVMPVASPPSAGQTLPRRTEPHLVHALAELALHAESIGTTVLIEPLNRYEDGLINRLEQAVRLCEEIGSGSLAVAGDFFHMNIEERDPARAIRDAGSRLRHIHVADSNRHQPGAGHLDFDLLLSALRAIEFDGWLTFECTFDGDLETALRDSTHALQVAWKRAGIAAA
jgi:sugar phosphate isomerase/epimerase